MNNKSWLIEKREIYKCVFINIVKVNLASLQQVSTIGDYTDILRCQNEEFTRLEW